MRGITVQVVVRRGVAGGYGISIRRMWKGAAAEPNLFQANTHILVSASTYRFKELQSHPTSPGGQIMPGQAAGQKQIRHGMIAARGSDS